MGARLREARRQARLTQRSVCEHLGVTAGMISRYEKGSTAMPLRRVADFAELVEVPVDQLVYGAASNRAEYGTRLSQTALELAALLKIIDRPAVRIAVLRLLEALAARNVPKHALDEEPGADMPAAADPDWVARCAPSTPALPMRAPDADTRRDMLIDQLRRDMVRSGSPLTLNYQPIVTAQTGALVGFEALLRWHTETGEPVPPPEAVALAAHAGLSEALDFWVLQEACTDAAAWVSLRSDLYIAVNVTGGLLANPECINAVRAVLRGCGVAPNQLCVEVVEDLILDQATTDNLMALRALGVRIAIDDFGTGRSNLARLLDLKVDTVKLDRSFFLGRDLDESSVDFLKSLVRMSHQRGAQVVAEGIACDADSVLARQIACDACQGFWFSEALSAEAARYLVVADKLPWATKRQHSLG